MIVITPLFVTVPSSVNTPATCVGPEAVKFFQVASPLMRNRPPLTALRLPPEDTNRPPNSATVELAGVPVPLAVISPAAVLVMSPCVKRRIAPFVACIVALLVAPKVANSIASPVMFPFTRPLLKIGNALPPEFERPKSAAPSMIALLVVLPRTSGRRPG